MASNRKLITAKKAQHQLDELIYKLEAGSPDFAKKFIEQFNTTTDLILQFPFMFKAPNSKKKNIRKALVTKYISYYYRVNQKSIRILFLVYNRSDPKSYEI